MIQKEADRILAQYISKDMSPQEYVPDDLNMLQKELYSVFPYLKETFRIEDVSKLRAYEISAKLKELVLEASKD